jgi:FAD/FMN-containing dehydrogenase
MRSALGTVRFQTVITNPATRNVSASALPILPTRKLRQTGDADDDDANIDWTRKFWQRMRSHSHHGRMYLNFPGHGEEREQILEDTFGANYSRLREIKRQYDPDNRFCFNQNLKPAG